MANTTHSVPTDATAQKLLDFVRKVVENNRHNRYTGCVTIQVLFNQGGIRSCEQLTQTTVCLSDSSDS